MIPKSGYRFFWKRSCPNNEVERDDDSKRSHRALEARAVLEFLAQRRLDHAVRADLVDLLEAENLGEALARTVHAALDRADLGVADHRRLLIGQTLGADEEERLALLGRELAERVAEIGEVEIGALLGRDRDLCGIDAVGVLDLAPPLPEGGMELITQDGEHPALEVRAALELVQVRKAILAFLFQCRQAEGSINLC